MARNASFLSACRRLSLRLACAAAIPFTTASALGASVAGGSPPSVGATAQGAPPAPGYVLADRGALVMRGGAMERREDFETWRGPAGEHWLRSVVTAADGSYRVAGEWRSDAQGRQHQVHGRGAIGGEALEVAIDASPGRARLAVRRGAREPEILEGNCLPECFVDLSPSAVAMFAMTRAADLRPGAVREFRWVGHSLTADSVLLDGVARFVRLGERTVERAGRAPLIVRHDAFQETVTDLRSGVTVRVFFNLWTDLAGRPLKFTSSRATGLREGYEDLAALAPAALQDVFPAAPTR